MQKNSEQLLEQFGQLFTQRRFVWAATQMQYRSDDSRHVRGPISVLRLWTDDKELTNAKISQKLDIKPSSVTALVNRLVEAGFAERHQDDDDKRVMRISLTAKGRKAIDDAQTTEHDFTTNVFAALSDEEQEQLSGLLAKLIPDVERQEGEYGDDDQPHGPFGFGRGFNGQPGRRDWPFGGRHHRSGFDHKRFDD